MRAASRTVRPPMASKYSMGMGAEPSVPMAQSTAQTTTSPARASTPAFAERIFSLMVLPAILCLLLLHVIREVNLHPDLRALVRRRQRWKWAGGADGRNRRVIQGDRKSIRLNSSHLG